MINTIKISELYALQASTGSLAEFSTVLGVPYILVELDALGRSFEHDTLSQPACPVIALVEGAQQVPPIVDVVVRTDAELQLITEAIKESPVAAATLVQLLRHNERASIRDGLFAESLAYSCLQHGARFLAWLEQRKAPAARNEQPAARNEQPAAKNKQSEQDLALLQRDKNQLSITLNRAHKRNAYSAGLRDALHEALTLVQLDKSIMQVVVNGAGVCFSAGGDLNEFGHADDAALAHVSRMTRSNALLLHNLRHRVEFSLHGACIGAGIEMPAFSNRVVAHKDSFFQLPEVAMGLIPGAGGTVSIVGRIGRLKTAYMAISNGAVDAETALEWGLIDAIL
ncbi:MAG: enoyl-CoA hydratase/isomerase family protein [Pseudomonadales bacterium]|nr:enoyl-CoA hydratase/isomerase family protein [Pseudomonadales bacterium]